MHAALIGKICLWSTAGRTSVGKGGGQGRPCWQAVLTRKGGEMVLLIGVGRAKATGAEHTLSLTSVGNASLRLAWETSANDVTDDCIGFGIGRLGAVWKDKASEAPDGAVSKFGHVSCTGDAGALTHLVLDELWTRLPG